MALVDHALQLAEGGWAVFPLNGKLPAIPRSEGGSGFRNATRDLAQIKEWWKRWPVANIGVAVPVGMVVIDIDYRHGALETVQKLELRHEPFPATLATITGAGGRHLWYLADFSDWSESEKQRSLGLGIDTRVGGRGYVLSPPSVHPETGKPYQWVMPTLPVEKLPEWVYGLLRRPEEKRVEWVRDRSEPFEAAKLLDWAEGRVSGAGEGQRHTTLRDTAIVLGGYVASGRVTLSEARRSLCQSSSGWPNRRKSEGTIDDGLRYGQSRPLD